MLYFLIDNKTTWIKLWTKFCSFKNLCTVQMYVSFLISWTFKGSARHNKAKLEFLCEAGGETTLAVRFLKNESYQKRDWNEEAKENIPMDVGRFSEIWTLYITKSQGTCSAPTSSFRPFRHPWRLALCLCHYQPVCPANVLINLSHG